MAQLITGLSDQETIRLDSLLLDEDKIDSFHSSAFPKYFATILLIIFMLTVCIPLLYAQDNQPKKVLVIHSYHHGLSWVDAIDRGIVSTLKKGNLIIETQTEYMDTKRIYSFIYIRQLYEMYLHKFRNRRFDVIICSDNNALNFLLKYDEKIFSATPIVFCGINNFNDSMVEGKALYTGTVEAMDIRGTLDIALKLHPKTRHIIVYGSGTTTYFANKAILQEIIPEYKDRVDFNFAENLHIRQIQDNIRRLLNEDLILIISSVRDEKGEFIPFHRFPEMMAAASSVPIYSCWDFLLGHGIVGGRLISGAAQGETAAQMALRILNGEKVKDIPVLKQSPNRYMFDNNQMRRFGVKLSQLPEGSIVINKPLSFYSQHKALIWGTAAGITFLTIIILVLVINIVTRKRAEHEIITRQKYHKSVLQDAPDAIVTLNASHRIVEWNPGAEHLFGYAFDEVVGKDIDNLISRPGTMSELKVLTKHLLSGKRVLPIETVRYRKDGIPVNVIAAGSPIQIDGELHGAVAVYTDITKRKQAEEALRQSEGRLKTMLDSMQAGIVVINADTHEIIDANPAAIKMIGTPKEMIVGYECYKYICPAEKGKCPITDLGQKKNSSECILLTANNQEVPILKTVARIVLGGKECLLESFVDITEKRDLEIQLRQAQKMEAIGTLAGGIAHDFNNILAAIIGHTEIASLLVDEGGNVKASLKGVLTAGERAKDLVRQILTFSRPGDEDRKPMQIGPVIKDALRLLRASLPTTVEIRQDIESDIGAVQADPTQIHQVLMNLCTNAAHAMQESGGALEVRLASLDLDSEFAAKYPDIVPGPHIRLSVTDTGHGMSPELLERIFDPYFTTKEKGVGTGLGLSVVHGIVTNLGGIINVYSEPGKGTVFSLFLPKIKSEADVKTISIKPYPTGSEQILFVDDEETLVDLGKQMLEHLGYRIQCRTSSIEALELFRAQPDRFDLVITDMTMPNMTGERLAAEIMKIRPCIPIILCSGFSELITEDKARKMGIRAFIMKPFVMQELANTIRKALAKNS